MSDCSLPGQQWANLLSAHPGLDEALSEFRPLSAFHFTEVFLRELKNQVADFEDSNDAVLVAGEEIKFDYIINCRRIMCLVFYLEEKEKKQERNRYSLRCRNGYVERSAHRESRVFHRIKNR